MTPVDSAHLTRVFPKSEVSVSDDRLSLQQLIQFSLTSTGPLTRQESTKLGSFAPLMGEFLKSYQVAALLLDKIYSVGRVKDVQAVRCLPSENWYEYIIGTLESSSIASFDGN
jgi:hypothetical protein